MCNTCNKSIIFIKTILFAFTDACIMVAPTSNSANRRVWDKQHCCVFCQKFYGKIPRHLTHTHTNEIEVQKALALPTGSKVRALAFKKLRLKGNYRWNMQVLQKKRGHLIVVKRPGARHSVRFDEYGPCQYCLGFWCSQSLSLHIHVHVLTLVKYL